MNLFKKPLQLKRRDKSMNSSTISEDPRRVLKRLLKMYDSTYLKAYQSSNYVKADVPNIITSNRVLLKELIEETSYIILLLGVLNGNFICL